MSVKCFIGLAQGLEDLMIIDLMMKYWNLDCPILIDAAKNVILIIQCWCNGDNHKKWQIVLILGFF
jgi:hypothetical protein